MNFIFTLLGYAVFVPKQFWQVLKAIIGIGAFLVFFAICLVVFPARNGFEGHEAFFLLAHVGIPACATLLCYPALIRIIKNFRNAANELNKLFTKFDAKMPDNQKRTFVRKSFVDFVGANWVVIRHNLQNEQHTLSQATINHLLYNFHPKNVR